MYSTLSYTGKSVTIPANSAYSIVVRLGYINTRPDTITLNTSDTNANSQVATGGYFGVSCSTSVCGVNVYNSPMTIYIWAKYAADGVNAITVTGFYIPI